MADSCSSSSSSSNGLDDRLSDLPDDILVLVLERLCGGGGDVRPLARTCVLSKRWRSLPTMVSRLNLTARSFLPPAVATIPVRCVHEAMSKFTHALRFFLATGAGQPPPPPREREMVSLKRRRRLSLTLRFYLTKHHRRMLEIGRLLSSAVARGEIRSLSIVVDPVDPAAAAAALGPRYASRFMRLFRAGAAVVGSALRQLTLRKLRFRRAASDSDSDLQSVLRACQALEKLRLDGCGGLSSVLTLDGAPPRLAELWIIGCDVERVHVVRLPRLLGIGIEGWCSSSSSSSAAAAAQACPPPLTFGPASAPALRSVVLVNRWVPGETRSFRLSDLQLDNAGPLDYLCLDFHADKIWVQPESRGNLRAAFSKLKKLRLRNISADADIAWAMLLITAAPLLELIEIHVYHEICSEATAILQDLEEWEETVPDHFQHHHLRTVTIHGATDDAGYSSFLRLVLERAVNLEQLHLVNDRVTCASCLHVAAQQEDPAAAALCALPEDKDAIDAFVARLKDGMTTSARILVHTASKPGFFEY